MSTIGMLSGWPEFDHGALGFAQVKGFSQVSGPSQSSRVKTLGGPSRGRTTRQRAGLALSISWLMTNAQVVLLRDFWNTELGKGQYPFAMQLLLSDIFVWRACQFLAEYKQTPVSNTDWGVSANVYVGYQADWALKPGAVAMPYQTPADFKQFPRPPGFLFDPPFVPDTVLSYPTYPNEINAYPASGIDSLANHILKAPLLTDI